MDFCLIMFDKEFIVLLNFDSFFLLIELFLIKLIRKLIKLIGNGVILIIDGGILSGQLIKPLIQLLVFIFLFLEFEFLRLIFVSELMIILF